MDLDRCHLRGLGGVREAAKAAQRFAPDVGVVVWAAAQAVAVFSAGLGGWLRADGAITVPRFRVQSRVADQVPLCC